MPTTGPTLSSTPVYLLFEGIYWKSPTGITAQDVIGSVNTILRSPYLLGATQYGTNGGAYLAGSIFDASLQIATLTQHPQDIFTQTGLINAVQWNIINQPASPSAQALYIVVPPPGTKDTCNLNFGGWHGELTHTFTVQIPYFSPWSRQTQFITIPLDQQVPFGWVGSFGATRSDQINSFSSTFSHELVESITDPYPQTHPGIKVRPGDKWNAPNDPIDEIADYEGNVYTFSLAGVQVQAYWSVNDHGFIVPDGNSQLFKLTPQWILNPADGYYYYRGQSLLTVDGDQLANPDDSFTVTTTRAGGIQVTLNGQTASFAFGQIIGVTLNTGSGENVVNIDSWLPGVPLTINAGSGEDVVNLAAGTNRMDDVIGHITIWGNSSTIVNINDQATADMDPGFHHNVAYTLQSDTLTRIDVTVPVDPSGGFAYLFENEISLHYINRITINGGNTGNNFAVQGIAAGTLVLNSGAGANTIVVSDAQEALNGITASLQINGGGADALVLDDRGVNDTNGFVNQVAFTVTASRITRVDSESFEAGDGPMNFDFETTIDYSGVSSLTVDAGSASTAFDVQGIASGESLTLENGSGIVAIRVLAAGVLGTIDVHGGVAASTYITLDDSGNTLPMEFDLAAQTVAWEAQGSDPATAQVAYDGVTTLTLLGGAGGNTFRVLDLPTTSFTLLGGTGINTLDYSSYTGDIIVDLLLGAATGFETIGGIENVTGSIGNDVLVGDGTANVLAGGTGRNVIIGGGGAAQIFGGAGDNILISGSTAYDLNLAALETIMMEWSRTDLDFQDRVDLLSSDAFAYPLTADTVFAANDAATVSPGLSQDWVL